MRMTSKKQEETRLRFAEKAASHFAKNKGHMTYTEKSIDDSLGDLMAMRWGTGNDCVLLVKLDEFFEPINYQNIIKED